jgi:hypothetical protein|eukprot:COSAG06_NODE_303_length_17863_cov_13.622326_8_plen_114_part_00
MPHHATPCHTKHVRNCVLDIIVYISFRVQDASHDVFWSLGPLRSYHLFHLSSSWINARDQSKSLAYFLHKCSVGKKREFFQQKARKKAMKVLEEQKNAALQATAEANRLRHEL